MLRNEVFMMGICRLCLTNKKLIEAHIIPRSFYALDSKLVGTDDPYVRKSPTGLYDPKILCGDCDNNINNKYDKNAKLILLDRCSVNQEVRYGHLPSQKAIFYSLADKSMYDVIAGFFISILWRASISTRLEVNKVKLGPYEEHARQVILGNASCFSLGFDVALCCFSDIHVPIQLLPGAKQKISNANFYIFIAGTIKVFVKVDKCSAPRELLPAMLSARNIFMLESKIKNIPEREILFRMANKISTYSRKEKLQVKKHEPQALTPNKILEKTQLEMTRLNK